MVGEAAHIHAASSGPGARRYLATMPSEERSNINNAIWLCANHARLIDRDEVTYTADVLREMKQTHEAQCAAEIRSPSRVTNSIGDLIAIGPDVICVGDILSGTQDVWQLSIRHFVEGDIHTLLSYVEGFHQADDYDRYVCVGSLGDGRVLRNAPSWVRQGSEYIVQCPIFPAFPRKGASELGTDLAISDANDLFIENGNIATVSGVAALPQKIKLNLSLQRGESPFYKKFGSRVADYYDLLRDSQWFEKLVKLEVIRLASIPYPDAVLKQRDTPFQCVEKVFGIETDGQASASGWLPINVDLGIKGLGRWKHEVAICVRPRQPRPSFDEMLGGPSV